MKIPSFRQRRSLTSRINNTEKHISNGQRKVDVRIAVLTRNIRQQLTSPATLLLACGFGFIIGELTKHRDSKSIATSNKPETNETTSLRTALSLMTSMRTFYTALLPLAWIIKSFRQPDEIKSSARTTIRPRGGRWPVR